MPSLQRTQTRGDIRVARQIDRLCDKFESRLEAQETPSIQAYLEQVSDEFRERLCVELVQILLENRPLSLDDALSRVPERLRQRVQAALDTLTRFRTSRSTPSDSRESRMVDEAPPEIAGYEVKRRLAAGGMGVVWLMRDLRMNRQVAAKVAKLQTTCRRSTRKRFENEARILAQLTHPSIIPVHAIGRLDDGRPYYIMKHVDGKTLSEFARAGTARVAVRAEFIRIFQNICNALAFAHLKGIVHRDLKPQNVMVGRHGEVQVMDWGLAGRLGHRLATQERAQSEDAVSLPDRQSWEYTEWGDVLGTPAYMAPEQAQGTHEVDARWDVFALGAMLCEMLTGRPPYVAKTRNDVIRQAQQAELAPAFAALKQCRADPELVAIAIRCLRPNKEERFRNGHELANTVRAYIQQSQRRLEQQRIRLARDRIYDQERRRRFHLRLRFGLAASLIGTMCATVGLRMYFKSRETIRSVKQRIAIGDYTSAQAELAASDYLGVFTPGTSATANALAMAIQLERIRNDYYTWHDGWFDCHTALDQYESVFREHGFQVSATSASAVVPASLASQIRTSAVRTRVLSAVDDWAWLAHREAERTMSSARQREFRTLRDRLLSAATQSEDRRDVSAKVRTVLRDPRLWDQPDELVLVARSLRPANHSAEFLVLVSKLLPQHERESFLASCHVVRPNDFWINVELGRLILDDVIRNSSPHRDKNPAPPLIAQANTPAMRLRASEAVAYYRAAVARSADRLGVRLDLAAALVAAGQPKRAIRECQRATEIASRIEFEKPQKAQAFLWLGLSERADGQHDAAIASLLKARAADPHDDDILQNLVGCLRISGRNAEARAWLDKQPKVPCVGN